MWNCGDMAAAGQPEGWSELPKDLVVMIGKRFSLFADYVRFRSVCVSWYAALATDVLNHHSSPSPSQQCQYFPFLFLHFYQDDRTRGLLSLPENGKIYQLRGLPRWELSSMSCRGSSHGWLFVAGKDKPDMNLINPFTRARLPLPPMDKLCDVKYNQPCFVGKEYTFRHDDDRRIGSSKSYLSVQKVVLSASPSSSQTQSSDVVAIAIFGTYSSQSLMTAFSRPGDKSWACLPKAIFLDVLFYKDHLYAVTRPNKNNVRDVTILVIHLDMVNGGGGGGGGGDGCRLLPNLVDTLKPPKEFRSIASWNFHLVESCGDLLLVARRVGGVNIGQQPSSLDDFSLLRQTIELATRTMEFRIFKICPQGNTSTDHENKCSSSSSSSSGSSSSSSWVEINDLGDRMLFLGVNSSFSLSAHDFPGCRGNCIYFTPNHTDQVHYFKRKENIAHIPGRLFDMGVFNLEDKRIEPLEEGWETRMKCDRSKLYPPPIWLTPTAN